MKRILALLLVFSMVFCSLGAFAEEIGETGDPGTPAQSEEPDPTPAPTPEPEQEPDPTPEPEPEPEPTPEPEATEPAQPPSASFTQGLVRLARGAEVHQDNKLSAPLFTLLDDGVAYAYAEEEGISAKVLFTLDDIAADEGYVAWDAFYPLTESETAVYLELYSEVYYEDIPLFALSVALAGAESEDEEDEIAEVEDALSYTMEAYGFPGMPEDYVLTAQDLADKKLLISDGTLAQLGRLAPDKDYIANQVLLVTESREFALLVAASYGASLLFHEGNLAVIELPEDVAVLWVITAAADPQAWLIAVRPNYIYRFIPTSNDGGARYTKSPFSAASAAPTTKTWFDYRNGDPFLASPNGNNYQYHHDVVGSYGAWGLTQGLNIVVGVLDTGVVASHPDLNANVLERNYPSESTFGITDGIDRRGHGTHVAGIIAAVQGNNAGGAGVAPKAKIRSYKVLRDLDGQGSSFDIVQGLDYFSDNKNVHLINASFGGPVYDKFVAEAVKRCIDAGIPVIASAGNDHMGTSAFPAGYPDVISVAATDGNNMRAPYSNYGAATLAAPGSYIWSTVPTGTNTPSNLLDPTGYRYANGTSMAAPVVSGVAALYYSAMGAEDRKLTSGDALANRNDVLALRRALTGACVKPSGGTGLGAGIISATRLFERVVTPPTLTLMIGGIPQSKIPAAVPTTATVRLAPGYNGNFIVYTTDGTTPSVRNGVVVNGAPVTVNTNITFPIPLTSFAAGRHTIRALAVSAYGRVSRVSAITININHPDPDLIAINGPRYVAAGRTAAYTASFTPVSNTQRVTWTLEPGSEAFATIAAATGRLTVRADAPHDTPITIKATKVVTAASPTIATNTYNITVNASQVKAITFSPASPLTLNVGEISGNITPTAEFMDSTTSAGAARMDYIVTTSNARIATVAPVTTSGPSDDWTVTAVAPGRATITFAAQDGSGRRATYAVTVRQPVTGITIDGGANSVIPQGRSKTLRAVVTPANATLRTVSWELLDAPPDVTLSPAGGVLRVPANTAGTIRVKCTANDGSGQSFIQELTITSAPVTSITLTTTDPKRTVNARQVVTGAQLYPFDASTTTGATGGDTRKIKFTATILGPATPHPAGMVAWTSSRPAVAEVDQDGNVNALSAGTTVITCTAQDGSGRRASVTVRVIIPASYIKISSDTANMFYYDPDGVKGEGMPTLAAGRSVALKATFGSTYGTPTIRRATWEISQVWAEDPEDGQWYLLTTKPEEDLQWFEKHEPLWSRNITITSAGRLTVKNWAKYPYMEVTVKATTTDGTNLSDTITYDIQPPTTRVQAYTYESMDLDIFGNRITYRPSQRVLSTVWGSNIGFLEEDEGFLTSFYFISDSSYPDFTIRSSHPAIGLPDSLTPVETVSVGGREHTVYEVRVWTGHPGTARITVMANDGTRKSCTFTLTVVAY
ncbi:MAG: S8 family serine peptidase [Clostridia bacterium]|nr:S8 family serine peptidase [Clostridia bacterium]